MEKYSRAGKTVKLLTQLSENVEGPVRVYLPDHAFEELLEHLGEVRKSRVPVFFFTVPGVAGKITVFRERE